MDIFEAVKTRHSVRAYTDEKISAGIIEELNREIKEINSESGLHFELFTNEATGFDGKLKNVKNYIAFAGKPGSDTDEKIGYYGAEIMLKAQMLGLNSCWVALSFNKNNVTKLMSLADGEKVINALALGYGVTQGHERKTKPLQKLCKCDEPMPDWFKKGMEAAMLAPTAINQQQFLISLKDGKLSAKAKIGPCNKIDLGIVKYFFELGSGKTFE